MKSLNLTIKQRKKLLKLCTLYFPEFKSIFITPCEEGIGGIKLNNSIDVVEFCKKQNANFGNISKEDFAIHWHELCYSILPKRIFEKTDVYKLSENEDIMSDWNLETPDWRELVSYHLNYSRKHIIDYLWNFSKATIHYRTS